MHLKSPVATLFLVLTLLFPMAVRAQWGVGGNAEYDIDYLTPKQYEIGGIEFENAENFDSRMILLVAGLQVGDKINIPGDHISTAIDNLWKQGMFEDVRITVTRIQGNVAFLKIILKERPKMNMFRFTGLNGREIDKMKKDMHLVTGDAVTENMLQTSSNIIRSYFIDKGYSNVQVHTELEPDTVGKGDRVNVVFHVNRGKKVKIDSLIIQGNREVSTNKILQKMKNTHDVHYKKKMRVWTKGFWTRSKYRESEFNEDIDNVITYYNEQGYRNARVVFDTVFMVPAEQLNISNKKKSKQDRQKVIVRISEGDKYYFRNITFSGNTVYTDEELAKSLRIEKGMPYNRTLLETNISYNPAGTDISSMYMDNGYLFFNCTPAEVAVENDSIDIEVRISEGKQARIRNVSVEGNTVTNDKVIYREIRTRPGDLFSRDDVLRSRRELITSGYFKQENLIPEPKPNAADGTVDIVYKVEEANTSQIQLQGGWGGNRFLLSAGLQLNNFSIRNVFNKDAWRPLPAGDGQKVGLNIGVNPYYLGGSLSFTEPWLGGKRPQSLTTAIYMNNQNNRILRSSTSTYYNLTTYGATIGLTRRLKWPDDYFVLSNSISFKHYYVNDSSHVLGLAFTHGHANDVYYNITLSRNSFDSPYFTRSGSELILSGMATPPYSLLTGKDYAAMEDQERYRWLEYYKITVRGTWNYNVIGNFVVSPKFRFGFMGYYNKERGLSPFGRYYVGGSGLQSYYYDGREIIPLRGYDENKISPTDGASVFDRFTLEMRYPIVESAGSTIWVQGFLEGGNAWSSFDEFQPFRMYKSAGLGVRVFLPMMGLLGFDWGYGFDGNYGGSHFHFSIGNSID